MHGVVQPQSTFFIAVVQHVENDIRARVVHKVADRRRSGTVQFCGDSPDDTFYPLTKPTFSGPSLVRPEFGDRFLNVTIYFTHVGASQSEHALPSPSQP